MVRDLASLFDKARRDAANRARGTTSAVQAIFRSRDTDDQILVERVRARLGRLVSHPHAIDATVRNGIVTLRGLVLQHEAPGVLSGIRSVPGVHDVDNQLVPHASSEHISSLQGGVRRERRSELMQQNWTPALRIAAGAVGAGLVGFGVRKRGLCGFSAIVSGAAILGRAATNRQFGSMIGIGGGPRVVEFEKAIHIQAPPAEVFRFFTDYEKLPRFMTHLKEVKDLGNRRLRWVAEGPVGVPISWDAELTDHVPNKLLAWRSVPGSTVETEGVVRFDDNGNGGTRVGIRMCYRPPAGVIGHYIAAMFGADPKSEMDDDMVRLKSLIEVGKTHAHGVPVTRESLGRT
jgi:uncharacterized membrane protein